MAYKTTDRIYIRTNYRGFITPLGMSGPIVIPLSCEVSDVMKMVMGGMEVFEVNPATKYSVPITLNNILDETKIFPKPAVDPFNIGKATVVTETAGVVPPARTVTPPPLVSESITGTVIKEEAETLEGSEEAETSEIESNANELVQMAANGQHLSKAQRRKLRQQQQHQAQQSATHETCNCETTVEELTNNSNETPDEE